MRERERERGRAGESERGFFADNNIETTITACTMHPQNVATRRRIDLYSNININIEQIIIYEINLKYVHTHTHTPTPTHT